MLYWFGMDYINSTMDKIQNILDKYTYKYSMNYIMFLPKAGDNYFNVILVFPLLREIPPQLLTQIAKDLSEIGLTMSMKFMDSAIDVYMRPIGYV